MAIIKHEKMWQKPNMNYQESCYRTLFEKLHFGGNCHARMLLSGIHLIEIEEIPAKNLRE
jgi:hypothetical protein